MSIESAIHQRWDSFSTLTALVPAISVYTGNAPTTISFNEHGVAIEQVTIEPPYVTIKRVATSAVVRTSSGVRLSTVQYQFDVWDSDLEHGKAIVNEMLEPGRFNRVSFAYAGGTVQDMKYQGHAETQVTGQLWNLPVSFTVRTEEGRAAA